MNANQVSEHRGINPQIIRRWTTIGYLCTEAGVTCSREANRRIIALVAGDTTRIARDDSGTDVYVIGAATHGVNRRDHALALLRTLARDFGDELAEAALAATPR